MAHDLAKDKVGFMESGKKEKKNLRHFSGHQIIARSWSQKFNANRRTAHFNSYFCFSGSVEMQGKEVIVTFEHYVKYYHSASDSLSGVLRGQ